MNEKKLNEAVKERMLKAMLRGFEGGEGVARCMEEEGVGRG